MGKCVRGLDRAREALVSDIRSLYHIQSIVLIFQGTSPKSSLNHQHCFYLALQPSYLNLGGQHPHRTTSIHIPRTPSQPQLSCALLRITQVMLQPRDQAHLTQIRTKPCSHNTPSFPLRWRYFQIEERRRVSFLPDPGRLDPGAVGVRTGVAMLGAGKLRDAGYAA